MRAGRCACADACARARVYLRARVYACVQACIGLEDTTETHALPVDAKDDNSLQELQAAVAVVLKSDTLPDGTRDYPQVCIACGLDSSASPSILINIRTCLMSVHTKGLLLAHVGERGTFRPRSRRRGS